MRVLWVTNLVAPPGTAVVDPSSARFGGWIANMLSALSPSPVTLGLVVRSPAPALVEGIEGGIATYFVPFARPGGLAMDEQALRRAVAAFAPDILHIEGAEMPHARQALDAFDGPALLSLQGVMAGLEPYEYGCLPALRWALGVHRPRRALMAALMIAAKATRFMPRRNSEAAVMASVGTIAGRTEWDRAHAAALAPQARYRHVGRILRPAFYAPPPDVPRTRHSIFVGNAHHPRKGAHLVVEALKTLSAEFDDVSLVIAGEPPAAHWRDWKRSLGYPAHLQRAIAAAGLTARVRYTGVLDARGVAAALCRAHVFLLPSLIENSPNTLGEAMMLARPCVCAYAGGAPDMAAPDREALFYRAEDPITMAHQIARIFRSERLAATLGSAAAARARDTHDSATNRDALYALYADIADQPATARWSAA